MPRTARGLNYVVTDLRPAWLRGQQSSRPIVFHQPHFADPYYWAAFQLTGLERNPL